jgi:Type II secretion system (T2SS), protein M subtype b
MTITERDRRALILLGVAAVLILIVRSFVGGGNEGNAAVAAPVDSIPRAEKRLEKLRQLAATVPGKEAVLKEVTAELAGREKGVLVAETAPQAQAQLLQIARTAGKKNNIDVRGGEFGAVRALGADYGEVAVAMSFECRIDDLVNFLAELTTQPEILATSEIRINSANLKEKTVAVRLGLTGVVPRKLVPAKRGLALF